MHERLTPFVSGAEYETSKIGTKPYGVGFTNCDRHSGTITQELPPFEKWREHLESPFNNRANAILALDG